MKKKSLLIAGAGACGLMAAAQLSTDFNVTILEAGSRLGGRIHSYADNNIIVEAGAEFIHGQLPITLQLLKAAGIEVTKVGGKSYRKDNNHFARVKNGIEGWNELLKKMKQVNDDISMFRFLEKFYPGDTNLALKKAVISYTEGFDVADIHKASVKKLYKEWSSEADVNFRIPGGYGLLVKHLEKEADCLILTNQKIKCIEWKENNVKAITNTGEEFQAEKIIITMPVSVLHDLSSASSINFVPAIPDYLHAASQIGFGNVIKAVIQFRKSFWPKDASFFFSNEEYFPTWWTQLPRKVNYLTGWSGGPKASELSGFPDDHIRQKAVESLARIFDIREDEFLKNVLGVTIFDWQKNIFTLGAYSYETVYSPPAKKLLNDPISNTIFFAGEALYNGKHPGTVEAALNSGKSVAGQIKKTGTKT